MRFAPAVDANTGEVYLPVAERGPRLLSNPLLNKGTAFTPDERAALGLRGLLPFHTSTMEEQLRRIRQQYGAKQTDLERHIYVASLHDRNETLFYRLVLENLDEMLPIIYTPTVADACRYWSRIFRRARGIYVTPRDRGEVARVLRSRGLRDAAVIVVTDNERILGIGDQGAGGMGIPIGKLAVYTVAAGIHPSLTVPISLDVGTNNQDLLDDPLYLGFREPRLRGDGYWALVDELVRAVTEVFPDALLQWEDFGNTTSFRHLDTYRDVLPSFNDDIQGTAAVIVAGMFAAMRRSEGKLGDQVVVIAGAGSAGSGIARQIIDTMVEEGVPREEVHRRVLLVDSKGLIAAGRTHLDGRKRALAADGELVRSWGVTADRIPLAQVVENARPSVLIGVSGNPGLITEPMVRTMAAHHREPLILPLSNPTRFAEAVPEDVIAWSGGRALVATGSPFDDVVYDGQRHCIGQANNVYVFPGVGLGVVAAKARRVTAGMFTVAARALADAVDDITLEAGGLYPPISEVRRVAHRVGCKVAEEAVRQGAANPIPDIEEAVDRVMWMPEYLPYRPA